MSVHNRFAGGMNMENHGTVYYYIGKLLLQLSYKHAHYNSWIIFGHKDVLTSDDLG